MADDSSEYTVTVLSLNCSKTISYFLLFLLYFVQLYTVCLLLLPFVMNKDYQ